METYCRIVWIDGTYGVGKTYVANRLKNRISSLHRVEVLESDIYWQNRIKRELDEAIQKNILPPMLWTLPQNDIGFINEFKKVIDVKNKNSNNILIIDMALTHEECKERLFNAYLKGAKKSIHIVLYAKEEIIRQRIQNDGTRDKQTALDYLHENICFLEKNYQDACWINAEKDIDDIVDEIMQKLSNSHH